MKEHIEFKYQINSILDTGMLNGVLVMPRSISIQALKKLLKENHGISKSTFDRDRNIEKDSKKSIPTDRLDAYAVVLGVEASDLKNYEVKGKSIRDLKATPEELENATGLKK